MIFRTNKFIFERSLNQFLLMVLSSFFLACQMDVAVNYSDASKSFRIAGTENLEKIYMKGNSSFQVVWDPNDLSEEDQDIIFELSLDNGKTFQIVGEAKRFSGSALLNMPIANTPGALIRMRVSAQVLGTTKVFTIDSTAPEIRSSTVLDGRVRGGAEQTLNLILADSLSGISSLQVEFESTESQVIKTVFLNTIPAGDLERLQLKFSFPRVSKEGFLVTKLFDRSGNISIIKNPLSIDSTPPDSPNFNFATPSPISTNDVTVQVSNCEVGTKILFTESSLQPETNSPDWKTCEPDQNFQLTPSDGLKTIRGWSMDDVENISGQPSSKTIVLDSSPPTLAILSPNIGTVIKGGTEYSLSWLASDALSSFQTQLEFSTDGGLTFQELPNGTNSNTQPWTVPLIDTNQAKVRLRATDDANNTSSVVSTNFIIDSTPPMITVPSLSSLRGGAEAVIEFSTSDSGSGMVGGLSSVRFEYSADGISFDPIATVSGLASSFRWSVPITNTETAKLRIIAVDAIGNQKTETTGPFSIDSTPPSQPTFTWDTQSPTNSLIVSFTASSCNDIAGYYVNLGSPPTGNEGGWRLCNTTAGGLSYITSGLIDGDQTFFVWVKDAVGNINPVSSQMNFVYDTTAPALQLLSPSSSLSLAGEKQLSVSWEASDAHFGLKPMKLEYSSTGTSPWTTLIASTENDGAFVWTIPSLDSQNVKFRLTASDLAGNISRVESPTLSIDSTPPQPPSISLTSSSPTANRRVTMTVNNCSDIHKLVATEGLPPNVDDDALWHECSTDANSLVYDLPTSEQGSRTINIWAIDSVKNVSLSSTDITIIYDDVSPQLTLQSLPNTINSGTNITITWSITEATISPSKSFLIEVKQNSSASWETIATVASTLGPLSNKTFSTTWAVPSWTTNDARIRISISDLAGNFSTIESNNFSIQSGFPNLNLTGIPDVVKGGTSLNLELIATTPAGQLNEVVLSYAADGINYTNLSSWTPNAISFSQTYAFTVPQANTSSAKIKLTATNSINKTASSESNAFVIDSTIPLMTANQFFLNGGATTTTTSAFKVSLKAADNLTPITAFCLKANSTTAPTSEDNCWRSVSASPPGLTPNINLSLVNFPFAAGASPGSYSIYAWVKDKAQNISTLSNAGSGTVGLDKASISYSPPVAPLLINLIASKRSNPGNPLDPIEDLYAPAGTPIYLRWKATDNQTLPATPIQVTYTLDGVTFSPVAADLSNGVNGSCTFNATDYTGCFQFDSPTTSAFSIRVTVTDAEGVSVSASSQPLNSKPLNIIAGNTDTGLGGSAALAVIFHRERGPGTWSGSGGFVVRNEGDMYLIDDRGLMKVDLSDGIYKRFLPYTGSHQDGSIAAATLSRSPVKIALDFSDRLLIYDNDRIKRVDFKTNTISTIIGGGSSTASGTSALQFKITPVGSVNVSFYPLPNGDIWFQTGDDHGHSRSGGAKMRIYKASLNQVFTLTPTGTGSLEDAAFDPTNYGIYNFGIAFNPSTSEVTHLRSRSIIPTSGGHIPRSVSYDPVTGVTKTPHVPWVSYWSDDTTINSRSGEMYVVNRFTLNGLFKYVPATNSWTRLLGTGTKGQCPDGTPALSCNMDIADAFIGDQDRIFFLDRGRIRTLDSAGKVVTLYGQNLSFGDGGNPSSARINEILWLDITNAGSVIFIDNAEFKIREFSMGNPIQLLAGTGSDAAPNTSDPANTQPVTVNYWGGHYPFVANPSNGNIFYSRGGGVFSMLDRILNKWVDFAGTGSTNDVNADGLLGNQIAMSGYPTGPNGFNGSQVLRHRHEWNGTQYTDAFLKLYDVNTGQQSAFAGVTGIGLAGSIDNCADGTALTSCAMPHNHGTLSKIHWDQANNRWLIHQAGSNRIRTGVTGGTMQTLVNLPHGSNAFVYVPKASGNVVYYCTSGRLHRYNLTSATDDTLPWPDSTTSCSGLSMVWNANRTSVVFPIRKNNLGGVAEYIDP
ncbi:MAG: hypothetical protein RJB66_531 [Pseudomonadota bacterium]|jgi:hypothetical protein